jgi:hypothetical protein
VRKETSGERVERQFFRQQKMHTGPRSGCAESANSYELFLDLLGFVGQTLDQRRGSWGLGCIYGFVVVFGEMGKFGT